MCAVLVVYSFVSLFLNTANMSKPTDAHDEYVKDTKDVTLSPAELEHEIEVQDQQSEQYMQNESLYDRMAFARISAGLKTTRALVITLGTFEAFSGMLSGLD